MILDEEPVKNGIGVNVYPNPSNGIFTIETPLSMDDLTVWDAQGRNVFSQVVNSNRYTIDLAENPSGIYYIRGRCGQDFFSEKVMLQR